MFEQTETDWSQTERLFNCDFLRLLDGEDSLQLGTSQDMDSYGFCDNGGDFEGNEFLSSSRSYGSAEGISIDGLRSRSDGSCDIDTASVLGSLSEPLGPDRTDGRGRKRQNEVVDRSSKERDSTDRRQLQEDDSDGNGKHWVFTFNNYTPEELAELRRRVGLFKHICWQGEIGNSGTPHLQGMCSFDRKLRRAQVKKLIGSERVSVRIRKGTAEQARKYCSKEETRDDRVPFEEYGTFEKGQGRRSDLQEVVNLIRDGKKESDVIEYCPEQYIKFHRGIRALIFNAGKHRDFKTVVHWYYGPTGTGKSKQAAERGGESAYWKNGDDFWWDGYEGQESVIIDDYRAGMCQFNMLLRLFDRYPLQVPYKGGFVKFVAKHIYVTTPNDPKTTWHNRTEEDIKQLIRRIEDVTFFPFNMSTK